MLKFVKYHLTASFSLMSSQTYPVRNTAFPFFRTKEGNHVETLFLRISLVVQSQGHYAVRPPVWNQNFTRFTRLSAVS